jgi:hypothetical protein
VHWDELFADLEAQFDELGSAELEADVAERTRVEQSRMRLVDRLRASRGGTVAVSVSGSGEPVVGQIDRVGVDWLLLRGSTGAQTVVCLPAVTSVTGEVSARAEDPTMPKAQIRLGLGHVLRGLSRDRTTVALTLRSGGALAGTVDRVGIDHLDLTEREYGVPRRTPELRRVRVIPFHAVAVIRPHLDR